MLKTSCVVLLLSLVSTASAGYVVRSAFPTIVDGTLGLESTYRVIRQALIVKGGISDFPKADAEKLLTDTLLLISGEEKDLAFKVLNVYSATQQTVSGSIFEITADVDINGVTKDKCVVSITEQPLLDTKEGGKGGKTEITCPDGYKKSYTHKVAERSHKLAKRAWVLDKL